MYMEKKMKISQVLTLFLAMAFVVTGCGTVVHGSRQNVRVNSIPAGATATIDGVEQIQTPGTVSLSRTKDHVIAVEKKGCKKSQTQVEREFNAVPTILGNILWLIPGLIVDFLAGGAWTLQPENVDVSLQC